MQPALAQKLVVEFIGTFFLVLTVGLAVTYAGDLAPLAIGSALMVMVFAGGHVSGAHFNPAITLAVFLRGKLSGEEVVPYWLAQIAAGITAALAFIIIESRADATGVGSSGDAFLVELLFTFALAWVVLNVATARGTEGNSFFGLAIGFTVATGAFAAGAISGAAFNPAVAIGALVMGLLAGGDIWIYLIATPLGAAAAAAAFRFVDIGEEHPIAPSPDPH